MDIIDIILDLMKTNNVNAYTLSKKIGISSGLFTQWKKKIATPSQKNIIKIAQYFNVSTDYLLNNTKADSELLKKYHSLDERGRKAVEETIERELKYSSDSKQN